MTVYALRIYYDCFGLHHWVAGLFASEEALRAHVAATPELQCMEDVTGIDDEEIASHVAWEGRAYGMEEMEVVR